MQFKRHYDVFLPSAHIFDLYIFFHNREGKLSGLCDKIVLNQTGIYCDQPSQIQPTCSLWETPFVWEPEKQLQSNALMHIFFLTF